MQGIEGKNSWEHNECLQQEEILLKSQVNSTEPKYLSAKEMWKSPCTGLYLAEHGFAWRKSDLLGQGGIECAITPCILSLRSLNVSVSWKKKWCSEESNECHELLHFAEFLLLARGSHTVRMAMGGRVGWDWTHFHSSIVSPLSLSWTQQLIFQKDVIFSTSGQRCTFKLALGSLCSHLFAPESWESSSTLSCSAWWICCQIWQF